MLRVPADLLNNGNIAVNCKENMLKSDIGLTVRNVRFSVVVLSILEFIERPRIYLSFKTVV